MFEVSFYINYLNGLRYTYIKLKWKWKTIKCLIRIHNMQTSKLRGFWLPHQFWGHFITMSFFEPRGLWSRGFWYTLVKYVYVLSRMKLTQQYIGVHIHPVFTFFHQNIFRRGLSIIKGGFMLNRPQASVKY